MTARTMPEPGRDAFAIACDFAAASSRLNKIAEDWQAGQYKTTDVSDAAHTLEGLARLLSELRQVAR